MLSCCAKFFFILGLLVFVAASVVTWVVVPRLMKTYIDGILELKPDSILLEAWQKGSYPIKQSVYFFQVENPDKIVNGEKPIVKEVGPYVFTHFKVKPDAPTQDGVRYKYKEKNAYIFNGTDSNALNTEITVLNAPLFAILSWASKDKTLLNTINANLDTILPEGKDLFLKTTVKKLLYSGIEVCAFDAPQALCAQIISSLKMIKEFGNTGKFSFFHEKVASYEESFSIESGREGTRLGELKEWNGKAKMNIWKSTGSCNDVRGSDGILFPSFVEKSEKIEVFKSDLCKSVPFHFKQKLSGGGKTYEFTTRNDAFPTPSESDGTDCYCLNQTPGIAGNGCLKVGAVEMNSCLGSHVVISPPHFYQSDAAYKSGVDGLAPRYDIHESKIQLDYFFGFLLGSNVRTQYNMFAMSFDDVPSTAKLATVLFPIFWIDETMQIAPELTEEVLDFFYKYYDMYEIISIAVIIASGVVTVLSLFCVIYYCCRSKK